MKFESRFTSLRTAITILFSQIKALLFILNAYGQKGVDLLTSDKPAEDKAFFWRRSRHRKTPKITLTPFYRNHRRRRQTTFFLSIADDDYVVCTSNTEINTRVTGMRALVCARPEAERVITLDAEWDTTKTAPGLPIAPGPAALIQLGYRDDAGRSKAIILKVRECMICLMLGHTRA